MDESEWAQKKAKEVQARWNKESEVNQNRQSDDALRINAAPNLWSQFVATAKQRVKAFNDAFGKDVLVFRQEKSESFEIGAAECFEVKKVSAEFIKDPRLEIRCRLVNTTNEYSFAVINGKVFLTSKVGGQTPEEAAEKLVDGIIQFL